LGSASLMSTHADPLCVCGTCQWWLSERHHNPGGYTSLGWCYRHYDAMRDRQSCQEWTETSGDPVVDAERRKEARDSEHAR